MKPFRRFTVLLLVCALSVGLCACGKNAGPAGRPGAAPSPSSITASAKKDDGLPELDCPPAIRSKLAGPDINGMKLGLSYGEALALARCSQKDAVVTTENNFIQGLKLGTLKLGPQSFTVQSGDTSACKYGSYQAMHACGAGNQVWNHVAESVTVATPGVPGHETAAGIWRTQGYKPGEAPAVETVRQALIKKYGEPQLNHRYDDSRGGELRMYWLDDPSGQPISAQNPLLRRCQTVSPKGDDSQSWSEACGLSISASIEFAPDNPLLVKAFSVGMMDQAKLFAYGDAMQAQIDAMERQRKQDELKAANDRAGAPKL